MVNMLLNRVLNDNEYTLKIQTHVLSEEMCINGHCNQGN